MRKLKSMLPITREKIGMCQYFIFGNRANFLMYNKYFRKSYSQDGEDMLLMSLYEGQQNYKGFYVDIGAHDPIKFSNTQYFYEKGWRGINIDATPGSMRRFNELRSEDINIECGVSDREGNLLYYSFAEAALNSFDPILSENRINNGWALKEKIEIPVLSINDILKRYLPVNQNIDFIDIDIEGMELQILKKFDFSKYSPKYFLLEDLNNDLLETDTEINAFMRSKSYFPILKCKRSVIYTFQNSK